MGACGYDESFYYHWTDMHHCHYHISFGLWVWNKSNFHARSLIIHSCFSLADWGEAGGEAMGSPARWNEIVRLKTTQYKKENLIDSSSCWRHRDMIEGKTPSAGWGYSKDFLIFPASPSPSREGEGLPPWLQQFFFKFRPLQILDSGPNL